MMNKNTLFNIVLALGLLILYVLHFTQKGGSAATNAVETSYAAPVLTETDDLDEEGGELPSETPAKAAGELRIAFVNADSLIKNYEYYKKIRSNMEAKARRSEQELEGEARKLEQEYTDAQKKAAGMSQEQLAMLEQTLMRKQQNVMMLRENLARELSDEEEKLDKLLRDKVQSYFKRLSKAEGYDYVLSMHYGSNVIYGAPLHDITSRVIADLNREYAEESKRKPAQK